MLSLTKSTNPWFRNHFMPKKTNAAVLGKLIEMSQYVNICECIKMLVASLKDAINENTENTNSFPRPEYREFSKNTERFPRPDHALCDITFYPAVVRIVQPCKRGNKFLFKFVYFLRAKWEALEVEVDLEGKTWVEPFWITADVCKSLRVAPEMVRQLALVKER